MQEAVETYGYAGLLVVSFLAATLLPLSSEAAVVAMQALGGDVWLILFVATVGNSLGGLTNYLVGRIGDRFLLSRWISSADGQSDRLNRARKWFDRWGTPVVVLSWLPIVGDPLVVVAGLLRANLYTVSFWVVLGKAARYVALLGVAASFSG